MKNHLFLTEKRKIPVGNHSISLLILRPQEKREHLVPGVLWIHGGGYQSGSAKDIFVTRALSLVVRFGAVLVAPDYRLSKRHPYPAACRSRTSRAAVRRTRTSRARRPPPAAARPTRARAESCPRADAEP